MINKRSLYLWLVLITGLLIRIPTSEGSCGVDWHPAGTVPDGFTGTNSITYGNGQFVATVNYPGGFLTSPDGVVWQWHILAGIQVYNDVTWGGNQFVAVGTGEGSYRGVQTSPDGVTWTARNPNWTAGIPFYSVTWNGSQYIAVGGRDTLSAISRSPDGVNWTTVYPNYGELRSVAWNGTQFVSVGRSPYVPGYQIPTPILSSRDGVYWIKQNSNVQQYVYQDLYDVTWGGNQFVAVGAGSSVGAGIQAIILTSPDGVMWTRRVSGTTRDLKRVAWGGNHFVAVGMYGTILNSPDGVTWTVIPSGTTNDLYDLIWGKDQFVTVGIPTSILTSPCVIPPTFVLTVSRPGAGNGKVTSSPAGINCGADCSESYTSGTNVTLTAIPAAGFSFISWGGACSGTNTTCTVSMSKNQNVNATFVWLKRSSWKRILFQ
jgi:hypothetical protein